MSIYPRLADELKLMVWKFSSMSPGVHYFILKPRAAMDSIRVEPIANGDSDPSAWRERLALEEACVMSKDVLGKLFQDQILMYEDARKPRRVHDKEFGIKAVVYKKDLVVLRFQMSRFELHDRTFNLGLKLQGLAHIGISWKRPRTYRRGYVHHVFYCLCSEHHRCFKNCPAAVVDLIPHMRDLEVLYFVYKIASHEINPNLPHVPKDGEDVKVLGTGNDVTEAAKSEAAPRGKKRDVRGVVKRGQEATKMKQAETKMKQAMDRRPVAERMRDVVERLRVGVKRDGLDIFHDRKGTYYEMRVEDAKELLCKDQARDFSKYMRMLRQELEKITLGKIDISEAEKQRRLKIQFKILVYMDAKCTNIPKQKTL